MAQLRSINAETKFRPKKSLGQHFLTDPKIIHRIITRAGLQASDRVLEIGPGQGALTLPLARHVGHVVAVEKDTQLVHSLRKRLDRSGIKNVTLLNHDILKWDFLEMNPTSPSSLKVIGNLPYNISSPVLEKLIVNRRILSKAVLMFQSEVAKRLTASPGGKSYGALTLLIQYHARTRVLTEVSKNAFYPKPKVDSMVLEMDFEKPFPRPALDETDFKNILKGAFSYRRKTILNSLRSFSGDWDHGGLLIALEKCGIEPERRAETLSMNDFLCLSKMLSLTKDI